MSEVEAGRTLGEALRAERRRRRETQRQTAVFFGVSQPVYHGWENGQLPAAKHHSGVAEFLGAPIFRIWV